MATKGWDIRPLAEWMLWANSSLPVPVSPVISTSESARLNFLAISTFLRISGLTAMMLRKVYLAEGPF